jgi:hypothetical protein
MRAARRDPLHARRVRSPEAEDSVKQITTLLILKGLQQFRCVRPEELIGGPLQNLSYAVRTCLTLRNNS